MQLKKSMLDDNVSVYQEKIENIWLSLLQDLVITISGSEIANYGLYGSTTHRNVYYP